MTSLFFQGAKPGAPPGGPMVLDTFTAPNGTLLNNHTPDIDIVGGGWVQTGGNPSTIQNGRLTSDWQPNTSGGHSIDAGIDEGKLSCDFQIDVGQTGRLGRFFVRLQDYSNNWKIDFTVDSTAFYITERVGGGDTLRAENDPSIPNDGVEKPIRIEFIGENISVYFNDVLQVSYGLASSFRNETNVGFRWGNSTTEWCDNWKVEP